MRIDVAESLNKGKGTAETIKGIKCSKGLCALHHAAAGGKTEICQYLIEVLGIPVDFPSSTSKLVGLYFWFLACVIVLNLTI
jgi:tRNA A37 threonylcarbamoyladenosine biosynthesis protein TsaE